MQRKKLIIVGDGATAEIAYEYFSVDSEYEVVAFAVEQAHRKQDSFHTLPVVNFETVQERFAPADHEVYVAITFAQFNRLRTRLATAAKDKGYRLASYVSSRAFVWRNVEIGEHCFIFEDNTIQPFVKIGDNVVLWSGNHIGHHSTVGNNCFISSHVVVSGFCAIGDNTFVGVNSTIADGITIARDNWIGPGLMISKNTEENQLFGASHAEPSRVAARRFFKIKED